MYCGFLSFLILVFLSVCVDNVRSSCRDYFGYIQDEGGVYGLITINYLGFVSSMIVRINFTIGARLASSNTGSLQPIGSKMNLLRDYNRGKALQYKVYFPVVSPLPRVTSITVNDKVVCYGQGDVLGEVQYVTTISLQYKLFYQPGSGEAYVHNPQNAPSPAIPQYNDVNHKIFYQPGNDEIYIHNPQNAPSPAIPQYNDVNHKIFYQPGNDERYIHNPQKAPSPAIPQYNDVNHKIFHQPGNVEIYVHNAQNAPSPAIPQYNDVNQFVSDNSEPEYVPQPQPQTPPPVPEYFITTKRPTTKRPVPKPSRPRPDPLSTQVELQTNSGCGINGKTEATISAPLIYNGVTYDPGEWPWLVAMYQLQFGNLNYICAGTLVSPTHVVSAAHCIHRKSKYTHKKNVVIRAGIYSLDDWNDSIVTRSLKELHIHDSYNSSTLENDILIMTLKRAVTYNTMVQPACLWSGNAILDEIVGKSGVVAGWGDSENGMGGKGIPRMVTMPVVSTDECRASNSDFHKLTSSKTLCAGERAGSGPCLGDSGGGLYFLHQGRWRLRGIVSLALASNGASQCDLNQYIVFTDTAQYLPWINYVMSIT